MPYLFLWNIFLQSCKVKAWRACYVRSGPTLMFHYISWYWCWYHRASLTVVALSDAFFVPFGRTLEKGSLSVAQTKQCRLLYLLKLSDPTSWYNDVAQWHLSYCRKFESRHLLSPHSFRGLKFCRDLMSSWLCQNYAQVLDQCVNNVSYTSESEWPPAYSVSPIIYSPVSNEMFSYWCGDKIRSFL